MNLLRKIGPLILIPITLLATIGFSLDVHFCQGKIKSYGWFGSNSCKMEFENNKGGLDKKVPPCHLKQETSVEKSCELSDGELEFRRSKCCHDQVLTFSIDGDLTQIESGFSSSILDFTFLFEVTQTRLQEINRGIDELLLYKPPWIYDKILIEYQVFRI